MKWTLIFLCLLLSSHRLYATGQASELIIYEGDTLELLSLPLESYLGSHQERADKFPYLEMCTTALWRGYIGLWKIEGSKLMLIDVYKCGERNDSLMPKLFGKESPIEATWFTGQLAVQHGEEIRYRHNAFDRVYEEETILTIEEAAVVASKHYVNGYRPDDTGIEFDVDVIVAEFHRRINWHELTGLSKEYKVYVTVQNSIDKPFNIVHSKASEAYVKETQRVIDNFPKLKKFYSRGELLSEKWSFPVIFSEDQRKRFEHN